jgi:autotransporter-associated beta strand protein
MKPRRSFVASRYPLSHRQKAAAVLTLLAAASSLHAQTPIYWNTNTTGLWADAANWNSAADGSGTTGAPANSQTVNSAVFNTSVADGAAIAQLAATRSIHGITFSNTGTTAINTAGANSALTLGAGGLTINAGAGAVTFGTTTNLQRVTFTIGQDQTWTNNSSNALAFNANNTILTNSRILTLDGTAGFGAAGLGIRLQGLGSTIKNGTGGLFVATNTQSGDFTLNSGTVSLQNNTNTFGTGVLKINGGTISSAGGSRSFGNSAYELNGTFGLTGGSGQSLTFTNGAVSLIGNSTITVTTITANMNTNISGSFGLTKGGTGALNLAGNNTYTGDTTVNAGSLVLTGGNALANAGKLAINGATTTVQLDADETVGFLDFDGSPQPVGDYSASSVPAGATITTASFTGASTLTVAPPLGKLVITSVPANAAPNTNFSVTVQTQTFAGAPLNVTQNTDISLGDSGPGTLSGNTITIPAGQNSVTLNSVQYTNEGTITLTASRTSGDDFATSVPSSSITFATTALAWSAAPATFNWNTTDLNWTGGTGVYIDPGSSAVTFDETGNATSPINLVGTLQPFSVVVNSDTKNYTFSGSGNISGATGIAKSGSSTLTVSTANTYTGVTTVSGGTLLNGSATTFANTGDLDVDDTGILDLNGFDASFRNLTDDNIAGGTITNSAVGGAMITLANVLDVDSHLRSAEFTGNLTVSIANSNASNGLAGLRTTNSFTGGLILRDGSGFTSTTVGTRLRILAAITGTPFGTGPITIGEANTDKAGMMMDTVANTISNNIVFNTALGTDVPGLRLDSVGNVVSGQITANLADATFSAGGASTGSATLTGRITGPSGLAMTPAASATTSTLTLTLNNAALDNDYAGNTTISKVSSSAYTLTLGAVNQIPNGVGKGNVVNDGTLDLNGFSETINGLSGTGIVDSIAGGTPVLTVGDNDQTSSFDGVIQNTSGTLALTKVGTGTLTLAGTNTYTGDTTVSGGELAVTGSSINDPNKLVINGGKVKVDADETVNTLFYGATPQAAGTYGSTASTATNKDDTRFSGTAVLTVTTTGVASSPYDTWAALYQPGFTNSLPGQDQDDDGLTNQEEFAFGLNPKSGSSVNPITVGLSTTTGNFSYTRNINSGLTYKVWSSVDLATWTERPGATQTLSGSPDSFGTQTVDVTTLGATAVNGKLFVRVTAE